MENRREQGPSDEPILYRELASWWPLLSSPAEYAEEAVYYTGILKEHCAAPPVTCLELGSGGGNNASHMKSEFEHLTLVDIEPGMLDLSRALNPECEHHLGDMRTVRLDREFDCVFVHDAVCYATTLEELGRVVETAFIHCRPGGAALFAPDFVRESFEPGTEHGGCDGENRGLRYLAWVWDPDPDDTTYLVDYAYLLREAEGTVQVRQDRHVEGLFATSQWNEVLEKVGFTARTLTFQHSEHPSELVVFVGTKP